MSTEPGSIKLPGTPKPWMNSVMMTMLRTPGVRSLLGKGFMILTVTGAKSGKRYTTPVQYVREGDRLLVLSQRMRKWWRNIPARPEVEVVLRGDTIRARARLAQGDEARAAIRTVLRGDRRTAKFYGITIDRAGEPDPHGVEQLDEAFVVIVIDLPEPAARSS